jgi:uncharacterized metal-binding protein
MPEKVTYQPCLGLTPVETTVGRQAGYLLAEELRPEKVALGCGPALNARVQEDIDFIEHYPVITVEGCDRCCAAILVRKFGVEPNVILVVPDVLREAGVCLAAEKGLAQCGEDCYAVHCGQSRPDPTPHLELDHPAVQAVAQRCAIEVDRLLAA